jgi:hypothetical protein
MPTGGDSNFLNPTSLTMKFPSHQGVVPPDMTLGPLGYPRLPSHSSIWSRTIFDLNKASSHEDKLVLMGIISRQWLKHGAELLHLFSELFVSGKQH